ncbi:MAG: NAD(P)H-dependent flavin oxidoreductase [Granulosicoccus sp.]
MSESLERSKRFAERYGLSAPILLAPMAGACPVELSVAVASAGGLGACGVLLMEPEGIESWVSDVRAGTNGGFQLNTWIPDPEPVRNSQHEASIREFLSQWGPEVDEDAGDRTAPDFAAQCEAMIEARPQVMSSIMGLYPEPIVKRMKQADIAWFATVTTVSEALAAEAAGADVIVAQGMEAGGHRGTFVSGDAEKSLVGLFSLLPAVVDAVNIPVVATGGIADSRGASAALLLGASAVQIGTGFLRTQEAGIAPAWAAAMENIRPEQTSATRAFSGRLGRSVRTEYLKATEQGGAPVPAPYPIQRNLTAAMRASAVKEDSLEGMQAWAGQSASLARCDSAKIVLEDIWAGMQESLS